MSRGKGQLARAMKRGAVEWDVRVVDPRNARGRRHKHQSLLNLLVLGFASGLSTLRRIEELSADLSRVARRMFSLSKVVSDTTLYMLLGSQSPNGLRETLATQVKVLWRRKRVANDLFPLGVVSLDGKSVWTSSWKYVEGARETRSDTGAVLSSLFMMNAVLVSSCVRPCLDLQLIKEKSGEQPAFREMVRRVGESFHGLFDIVMGDAGLLCKENVLQVLGLGKDYVLALKGNQPKLFNLAVEMFRESTSPARITTTERRSGFTLTRTLETLVVGDVAGGLGLQGAQEIWRVEQEGVSDAGQRTREVRFFVSSLSPRRLSPSQKLQLVRLHWGIENNRHWTLDAVFDEDDRQPCQLTRRSIEVGCWLRALAYNLVAARRSTAVAKDRKPQPWRRTMQKLRDLLVGHAPEVLTVHLA